MGRGNVGTRGRGDSGTRERDKQTTPDFFAECVKYNLRSCRVNKLTSLFSCAYPVMSCSYRKKVLYAGEHVSST